jgi:hypothetical protein
MELKITIEPDEKNPRILAQYRPRYNDITLHLINFWPLCNYDDIESVAQAVSGAFLVELCCWKWMRETNQFGNWFMGILKMPCHKTNGLLCPINKLFNKINEGMLNVEREKEREWEENNGSEGND